MKVFYHNDLDGRCSGAIIWQACQQGQINEIVTEEDFVEMNYDKPFPVDIIQPHEFIYILDYHIQDDNDFIKLQEITKNIILIDHHKSTLQHKEEHPDLYENIKECIIDIEHSGCWLTWLYCNMSWFSLSPHEWPDVPEAVKLIDDMDRWAWQYPQTNGFTVGIKLYPHQPWDNVWKTLLQGDADYFIHDTIVKGETCVQYDDMVMNNYCNSYGWETEFEGHKAFAQGQYRGGSIAFGERIKQYPLCLSYEFLGDKWIVGLYSATIDVSEIAVKYGGGGHKGASGFVCKELPFKKS